MDYRYLRINVALTIFQSYRKLEAGDTQSIVFKLRDQDSKPGPLASQTKTLSTRPPPLPLFYYKEQRRWLAKQELWSLIPGLATTISEIGYLLLPSRDMAEILLKRRKSSKQRTNHPWTTRNPDWQISVEGDSISQILVEAVAETGMWLCITRDWDLSVWIQN